MVQDLELAAGSPDVGGPARIVTGLEAEGDRQQASLRDTKAKLATCALELAALAKSFINRA